MNALHNFFLPAAVAKKPPIGKLKMGYLLILTLFASCLAEDASLEPYYQTDGLFQTYDEENFQAPTLSDLLAGLKSETHNYYYYPNERQDFGFVDGNSLIPTLAASALVSLAVTGVAFFIATQDRDSLRNAIESNSNGITTNSDAIAALNSSGGSTDTSTVCGFVSAVAALTPGTNAATTTTAVNGVISAAQSNTCV